MFINTSTTAAAFLLLLIAASFKNSHSRALGNRVQTASSPAQGLGGDNVMVIFTINSVISGNYINMMEDGSVEATGDPQELSSQWNLHTSGNVNRFENVRFTDHYLIIAMFRNKTKLISHNLTEPLNVSKFDDIASSGEEYSEYNTTTSSGDGESMRNESDVQDVVSLYMDWIIEPVNGNNPLTSRFKIASEDLDSDCYLAFDRAGSPISDLCSISKSSENVILKATTRVISNPV